MIPLKDLIRNLLPRNVRKHRILTDTLQGKYIVTSWYDYPAAIMGYTEHRLLDWFSQNVQLGETWLDVGAHYGYTAIALSRLVGTTGRVFAFEPMISTAGYLAQTRLLNGLTQLTVLPLALACPQSINMNQLPVTRGMVDSTVGRMHLGGEQKEKWLEIILTANFDWLWPRICGDNPRIDGIKIDVQGMEIEVIRGMMEMLRAKKPKLVVEIHKGVDREVLLDLIERTGYLRQALPVEPIAGEIEPQYLDNRSYAFVSR